MMRGLVLTAVLWAAEIVSSAPEAAADDLAVRFRRVAALQQGLDDPLDLARAVQLGNTGRAILPGSDHAGPTAPLRCLAESVHRLGALVEAHGRSCTAAQPAS
jgi:hypothetical protein